MKKEDKIIMLKRILKITAMISLVYSILISALMLINYYNLVKHSPLESEQILGLIEKIDQDPQSQGLKEAYRSLNLVARKAFFTSTSQINSGRTFLIIGLLVFFLSMQFSRVLTKPAFSVGKLKPEIKRPGLTSYSAAGFTVIMLVLAFVLGNLNSRLIPGNRKNPDKYLSLDKNSAGFWNSFRNSARPFTIPDGAPLNWDAETGENIVWQQDIELPGFSSPVIWKDRIYLTSADTAVFRTECRNLDTGELIWKKDAPAGDPESLPFVQDDTGYAAPSPAVCAEGIFSIFATGLISALDHKGRELWTKQLEIPDNHYGHSSSLLIYDNMLYVQFDTNEEKSITALNVSDGSEIWNTERSGEISWTSPILAEWKDKVYLLLSSSPFISAYEPYSGMLVWETECLGGEVAPSLAFSEGIVSAAQAYSIICSLNIENGELLWTESGALPDVSSPISTGNFLFVPSSYGTLTALKLTDKSEFWYFEQFDGFYSSPVIINNYVYISDLTGYTIIFSVSENMETAGEGRFNQPVYATPAATQRGIVYRTDSSLFLVSDKGGSVK